MPLVTCHDKDGKLYEVPSEELSFRPSAYGVIIQDGKILLSKQWDGYDFPGGGMEMHETIEAAVIREVKEETGYDVRVQGILSSQSSFFAFTHHQAGTADFFAHTLLLYYLCAVTGGEASIDGFDAEEKIYADMPEWVPLDQVRHIRFYNSIDSPALIDMAMQKLKQEASPTEH